jgi:hypothetical protein
MRKFHPYLIGLLFLFIATGVGYRDGGITTGPARLEAQPSPAVPLVPLPNKDGSFKFGVLGDFGNASTAQYQLAEQMIKLHGRFKFDTVVTVGDNMLGSERPQDFKVKFELPYKPLLDAGVKFYASLGNHDAREQRFYKLFNMGGTLFYTFNPGPDVRFFMLEATYPTPEQFEWLEKELKASNSNWKIAVFHQPIYSSGDFHGSDVSLRRVLEPFFVKYNVSVAFSGHDHFYERVNPQKGIAYFVVGSGGSLRVGNIDRRSGITAKGFDTDQAFMAAEIIGDEMYFNAISRTGQTIDSGVLTRRKITP